MPLFPEKLLGPGKKPDDVSNAERNLWWGNWIKTQISTKISTDTEIYLSVSKSHIESPQMEPNL